jgi:hypothetical protein
MDIDLGTVWVSVKFGMTRHYSCAGKIDASAPGAVSLAAPDGDICSFEKRAMATLERNELHYGDNLTVMREKIPDEIADLTFVLPGISRGRAAATRRKSVSAGMRACLSAPMRGDSR